MKKIVLGAALFLLVNSTRAAAADRVSHNGKPHDERNHPFDPIAYSLDRGH